jgi:hypothetical protein
VRTAIAVIVGSAIVFGAVTWLALESSGVAVLRTQRPDGSPRETRVWYAEDEGSIWIEAATPEREFLLDVRRTPAVTLTRRSDSSAYDAAPVDPPSGHDRIRVLLRRKYGLRDWWIGLLQDTSRSVAVRLTPSGRHG